jgi:hypothetical protein
MPILLELLPWDAYCSLLQRWSFVSIKPTGFRRIYISFHSSELEARKINIPIFYSWHNTGELVCAQLLDWKNN